MKFSPLVLFFVSVMFLQAQNRLDRYGVVSDSREFKIVPNPVVSNFEIILPANTKATILIEVFDVTGDVIYRKKTVSENYKINASEWISGSYIVRVSYKEISIIKRLVKL